MNRRIRTFVKNGFILTFGFIICMNLINDAQAQSPSVTDVSLAPSSGTNSINADMLCDYLLSGSATTAANSWYRNSQPLMNLYLPFEGGLTNSMIDYSGNNVTLGSVGAVSWSAAGGHDGNGAISLNGSSYLTTTTGFPTNSSYTTSAWIYQTGYNGYSFIFGSNNTGVPGHGLRITYDGYLTAGHNYNWRIAESGRQYEMLRNVWYFVAVTYDNATGEMILYRDGVPIDTGYAVGSQMVVNDPTLQVGAANGATTFIGQIDDARIYNFALTRDQIVTLYSTNGTNIINAAENELGDIWQARVTPFSSTEAGPTVLSNEIEIIPTSPTFTSSPVVTGIEGKKYTYTATADGGPYPTFAIDAGPAGMSIDPNSGKIFWTPTIVGDYNVTLSASNSGGVDIQPFTISVAAPSVGISNPQLQALGNGNLEASHSNTLSATTSATAWLKNSTPFMELYMPFEGGLEYSLEDYSGNDKRAVAIDDPVWIADGGHDGNGAYEFDGNDFLLADPVMPLSSDYTKTIWLYHTVGGNFEHMLSSWDHSSSTSGGHGIRISFDNRLAAGQNGNWRMVESPSGSIQLNQWYFAAVTFDYSSGSMILYVNGVPVDTAIVPANRLDIADSSVLIGATQGRYAFQGKLDDARIYNTVLSPEQIAAMYTANGDNIIVADETTDGDTWQTEVTAFSSTEASVPFESNLLLIGASNQPPTLAAIGTQSVNENGSLVVGVSASDPDATFPSLSAVPLPANASFVDHNDGTGTFTFNPDFEQAGTYDITFTASDGLESDNEVVTVTVHNINRAPQLATIDNQLVAEGAVLNMVVTATDADNDALSFSADSLIENMLFVDNNDGTASFSFSPSFLQAGIYTLSFYVADDSLAADSQSIQIVVTDIPQNALWSTTIQTQGLINGTAVSQAEVVIGVQTGSTLIAASPAPPEYTTNLQLIALDNSGPYYSDIRELGNDCYYWTLDLDPHGNVGSPVDPQCATLSWNSADFSPDHNYVLREGLDPAGPIVVADMRSSSSYQVCDIQTSRYYTVHWESNACSGTVWTTLSLSAGWNLVSLPVTPNTTALNELIPSAEVAYEFNNGYNQVTELFPCTGYWVKVPSAVNLVLTGTEINGCTSALNEGWHLVGAPNCSALPLTTPGGSLQAMFGYNGSYNADTNTDPGFGYWVEISPAATLDLSCAAPVSSQSDEIALAKPGSNLMKLTVSRSVNGMVSDASVEIGADVSASSMNAPPIAPEQSVTMKIYQDNWEGPFYRAIQNNNSNQSIWKLAINPVGTETTVTDKSALLSWTEISMSDDLYTLYEGDGVDGIVLVEDMHLATSIDISGRKQDYIFTVVRTAKATDNLPNQFVLNQNYPNPFNPTTEISYSIPNAQNVRLDIYNVIGQKVKTLVNGRTEAGAHSVYWNSTDNEGNPVSSGIYLYRLVTDSFTDSKKMVLLK